MFKIRKKFKFEMAHRLMSSYSTCCQQLHGHSYVMEVVLTAEKLNEDGMVLDFGKLKEICQDIIQTVDHSTVLNVKDGLTAVVLGGVVTVKYNPTAEEMARDFCQGIFQKLDGSNVLGVAVRLHETETGWAEYSMTKNDLQKYFEELT